MKGFWVFIATLFSLLLSAFNFNCSPGGGSRFAEQQTLNPPDKSSEIQTIDNSICWFPAKTPGEIKGVALAIHGLNLRPDKMESIISLLTDSGIEVLNLSLRGHGRNYSPSEDLDMAISRIEAFKTVSYKIWNEETYQAYNHAKKRSEQKNVPLFLVGYSLGGLMGVDLFTSHPDVNFDRMVLFAPALNLSAITYAAKLLSPFPKLVVPSLASKSYRANNGTPVAAYNALFNAIEHFRNNLNPKLNVPTLIFICKRDELVSYYKLKRLVEKERLDQWKFYHIQKGKDAVRGTLRHLIIDESSVGKEMWKEMRRAMVEHLLPWRHFLKNISVIFCACPVKCTIYLNEVSGCFSSEAIRLAE